MSKKYQYKKPENKKEILIDVPLPSGNVIQMAKPSKYGVLFGMQNIPSNLTDRAVEAWEEKGVGNKEEIERRFVEESSEDERKMIIRASVRVRDEVLRLSRQPRLVLVDEGEEGTLCISELVEDDIDFLFKWVSSGGTASTELESFREGPEQSPVDSPYGKTLGDEAVKAAGTGE